MKNILLLLLLVSNFAYAGIFSEDIEKQSQSETNIIVNAGAENGTSSWDASGSSVFTIESSDVGAGSSSFSWDATSATEYLESEAVLIPQTIGGVLCLAEAWVKGGGTSDITMEVYDADGDKVGETVDQFVISNAVTDYSRAFFSFMCPANTDTVNNRSLKLRFTAAGNAALIKIDKTWIGVRGLIDGPRITGWQPYTPITQGFGTITADNLEFKESGDGIQIRGDFVSGTTTAVEAQIGLPIGYTIGGTSSNTVSVGKLDRDVSSSNAIVYSLLATNGDAYLNLGNNSDTGASASSLTPALANALVGSTERLAFTTGTIPIAELNGSNTVNLLNNSVIKSNSRFGADKNGVNQGISDSTITKIDYTNEVYDKLGDYNPVTSEFTAPSDGEYVINASTAFNATVTNPQILIYVNGASVRKRRLIGSIGAQEAVDIVKTLQLNKDDVVDIRIFHDTGSLQTILGLTDLSSFTIERKSDTSSEDAFGFGEADIDHKGLNFGYGMFTGESEAIDTQSIYEDVGPTVTLLPGDYVAEYGGVGKFDYTAIPTRAAVFLRIHDNVDAVLGDDIITGMAVTGSNTYFTNVSLITEFTLATTTTINLNGTVGVVGGATSNYDLRDVYLKVYRKQ